MIWTGLVLLNAPTLMAPTPKGIGWFGRLSRLSGAMCSPLFLFALFYAQATDTIANAVALADQKYGQDPRYQRYVQAVPLLLPTLASIGRFFRGGAPSLE